VRCVEYYSKEGQKKGRNGTIIGFPLITIIPISAAAVATYLFVDPCGLDPIFQDVIDHPSPLPILSISEKNLDFMWVCGNRRNMHSLSLGEKRKLRSSPIPRQYVYT
jgi:hypothetical protein